MDLNRSGSKVLDKGPPNRISPAAEATGLTLNTNESSNLVMTTEDNEET